MRLGTLQRPGMLDGMPGSQPTDIVRHNGSPVLVYLAHGITGTPAEMRYLAAALAHRQMDVYATTLPGHCRGLRDLVRANEELWREHVQTQLRFARSRYERVFAAGLSAGGSLILDAAAELPLDGIGVLSPTFFYDGWNQPWTYPLLPLAMRWIPSRLQPWFFHVDGPPYGIKDPVLQRQVRAAYSWKAVLGTWVDGWRPDCTRRRPGGDVLGPSASKGFPIFPLKCFTEIDRLTRRVLARLSLITAPALILQAREDDMTSPRNAYVLRAGLGSRIKKVVLLDDCYHVLPVDKQRKAVARHLHQFFLEQAQSRGDVPGIEIGSSGPCGVLWGDENLATRLQGVTGESHHPEY